MRTRKPPAPESLLRKNRYLKDPGTRKAMTLRSVRNSCAVEGLRIPAKPKRSPA